MKKTRMKRVTISLDQDDYEKFEEIAEEMTCSCSFLIRQSMKQFIKTYIEEKEIHAK